MASSEFRPALDMGYLEAAGGYPDDLQTQMALETGQMFRHYTKATASERAVRAHKRVSPSDGRGCGRRGVLQQLSVQVGREGSVGQLAMPPGSCPRRRHRLLLQ